RRPARVIDVFETRTGTKADVQIVGTARDIAQFKTLDVRIGISHESVAVIQSGVPSDKKITVAVNVAVQKWIDDTARNLEWSLRLDGEVDCLQVGAAGNFDWNRFFGTGHTRIVRGRAVVRSHYQAADSASGGFCCISCPDVIVGRRDSSDVILTLIIGSNHSV